MFPGDSSGGNHSSSNHNNNHLSRANDVALTTFNDRSHHPDDMAQPKNYACFASSEVNASPFSAHGEDDNRVVMTTEVVVKSEDARKPDEGAVTRMDNGATGRASRQIGRAHV